MTTSPLFPAPPCLYRKRRGYALARVAVAGVRHSFCDLCNGAMAGSLLWLLSRMLLFLLSD
jgi:hypothetical protein